MMSSPSMQTFIDPVFRNKMPLFEGTIASTGLSKPQNMSGFLGKQTLQYSGAYFAYDPRGKDRAGFTPPWSNSKTSLLGGRSPVSHLSGMEGQNHIIYRQDSNSPEEGHSHSSSICRTQVKQGFTLYTKSPGVSSPTAATSVAVNSSPPPENSVYLAIPKPVYGLNPCCNELACMIRQRYAIEHGSPRIPNTVYEHDWMQPNTHYAERLPIQMKAQDALLPQRGLQLDHSAEPVQRMAVGTYSPSRARTFPAMIDPNYRSYPCTPTQTLFGSLSEQSQCLQTPPRGYPSLYPSHATHEHMTSEVYEECSPMSKYGQLTQHPIFYYPQANVELENRTQCKDISSKQREDVPVILKHPISKPREHFIVPQSLHGEIPLPSAERLPNHAFMRGFDYPCYAVPRFHQNASQIRHPLKMQHASPSFHSTRVNASPSSQHMDHLIAPAANLHKEKPNAGLHVAKAHSSSPFLSVDQTSPSRHTSQSGISPSSIQMNRFFSPLTSLHIDRPILPPAGITMDRLMDINLCEAQLTCPKRPKGLPVSPVAWLPRSPSSDSLPTVGTNSANVRKTICSPTVSTGNEHNSSVSSSGTTVVKGCLKRSVSQSSPPIKIKEEDGDLCEVELIRKRKKVEIEKVKVGTKTDSPPMPVIDNVFSLAPYQTYLQASGVLFQGRSPQRTVQLSEHHKVKIKPDVKENRSGQDEQQAVDTQSPPKSCPGTSPEKPAVEIPEPKTIKVEKVESSDTDDSIETPVSEKDCSKMTIKKEPEETGTSDDGPMLVIKMCEPDELERKPLLEDETSDESKPTELATQKNSSTQGDRNILHEQVVCLQNKSITPPQPQVNFKNIPPQCLKLSTYKIIIPDTKSSSSIPPPEKSPLRPITEFIPKIELQMPVRKHFLELHHSLCKLVSKSVSGSSDQELRTWLSQLKLTEPTSSSTKVQKVSCLLGVKAREVWFNEEIKSALHKVLERLREYTKQDRCPFPHVMRTGAVFLPMLVVKELLFPMVQGSFIDQVLQEHKVELRPTTLSEEKILIQLHKQACSSRLRRLMSLKHLPDIYADAVNLFYYSCVCKHVESTSPDVQKRVQSVRRLVDHITRRRRGQPGAHALICALAHFRHSGLEKFMFSDDGLDTDDPANREQSGESPADITASPASPSESHPQRNTRGKETTRSHLNRNRTKNRAKSSSHYIFLDTSLSDEEDCIGEGVLDTFRKKIWGDRQSEDTENRGSGHMVAEDSLLMPQSATYENSWTCPLTLDEFSPSDTETEECSSPQHISQSSGPVKSPVRSNNCSGVILKLRRMFSESLKRKKACYQAVSNTETFPDASLTQTDGEGEVNCERDLHQTTPKVTHKWQRTGSFSHALRPLSGSSKRKHSSLLKIKYCPYLSACHSAEHRRRWVLRSAVQRARRAMRFYYPDLVGKRIHHLYEEDDKSEVWYRGEVLRIHEAHSNPLKTVFEVRYDSEPEWKYYLELLIDYKKGWLKIED